MGSSGDHKNDKEEVVKEYYKKQVKSVIYNI